MVLPRRHSDDLGLDDDFAAHESSDPPVGEPEDPADEEPSNGPEEPVDDQTDDGRSAAEEPVDDAATTGLDDDDSEKR
jgi:hypothetical protein